MSLYSFGSVSLNDWIRHLESWELSPLFSQPPPPPFFFLQEKQLFIAPKGCIEVIVPSADCIAFSSEQNRLHMSELNAYHPCFSPNAVLSLMCFGGGGWKRERRFVLARKAATVLRNHTSCTRTPISLRELNQHNARRSSLHLHSWTQDHRSY